MSSTSDIRHQISDINLHRLALLLAVATFVLLVLGGTVTSQRVGMSVPDWPRTYGHNMFLFPPSLWRGGVFWEHTHRLMGSVVGLLTLAVAGWLWVASRRGGVADGTTAVGGEEEKTATGGRGFARSGEESRARRRWLPALGLAAVVMVIVQGVMGGLRVTEWSLTLAVLHGILGQVFFVVTVVIAAVTRTSSPRRGEGRGEGVDSRTPEADTAVEISGQLQLPSQPHARPLTRSSRSRDVTTLSPEGRGGRAPALSLVLLTLLLVQLALGATMRHTGTGLAIYDFPASYGRLVPPLDQAGIHAAIDALPYHHEIHRQRDSNGRAVEVPTPGAVAVAFAHRVGAVAVVAAALWLLASLRYLVSDATVRACGLAILVLLVAQVALGASVIWSGRHPEVATAHQSVGALTLAAAALLAVRLHGLRGHASPARSAPAAGRPPILLEGA